MILKNGGVFGNVGGNRISKMMELTPLLLESELITDIHSRKGMSDSLLSHVPRERQTFLE